MDLLTSAEGESALSHARYVLHEHVAKTPYLEPEFTPVSVPSQIAVLLALTAELFDRVPLDQMMDAEHALYEAAANIPAEVCARFDKKLPFFKVGKELKERVNDKN